MLVPVEFAFDNRQAYDAVINTADRLVIPLFSTFLDEPRDIDEGQRAEFLIEINSVGCFSVISDTST